MTPFAQVVVAGPGWGVGHFFVLLIAVCAVAAIAWVIITRAMGLTVPPWLVTVFWIVVAAVVGIFAIRLVLGA